MVIGWTIRTRARSRRCAAALPAVAGPSLAQSDRVRSSGHRSTAGRLGRLLAWTGVFAAVALPTAGIWWLLALCLPVSFALRLH